MCSNTYVSINDSAEKNKNVENNDNVKTSVKNKQKQINISSCNVVLQLTLGNLDDSLNLSRTIITSLLSICVKIKRAGISYIDTIQVKCYISGIKTTYSSYTLVETKMRIVVRHAERIRRFFKIQHYKTISYFIAVNLLL